MGSAEKIEQVQGHVVLEKNGATASIRLGADGEKIAILTEQRIRSLEQAVDTIAQDASITGVVITAPRGGSFCGGADINEICKVQTVDQGKALAREGQRVFQKLEDLKAVTVAAINGPCVGGGCELVLACDYRVASDSSKTKIGLPEVKLGILPGFGGTQRLPRLIGLPKALDIILNAKVLPASAAYKVGLVDVLLEVGSEGENSQQTLDALEEISRQIITKQIEPERKGPKLLDKMLTFSGAGRALVKSQTLPKIMSQTGGNYPAPLKSLDICIAGLREGLFSGYELEASALGELIVTPESRSLVHLYFIGEASQKLGKAFKVDLKDYGFAVIGGGVMGSGIAAACAAKGANVSIIDPAKESREKAKQFVTESISKKRSLSDVEKTEIIKKVNVTDAISDVCNKSYIIEAAVEKLEVKKTIFQNMRKHAPSDAILATNTSSLSIEKIAQAVDCPERVVGLHFFNPVDKMPLVEVVRSSKTSEKTMLLSASLATALGKYPVIVEDVTGFLVNRILSPYLIEAGLLLSEGYTPQQLDKIAKKFGMPMGPIRLIDEVGLDIASKVSEMMVESYGERMKGAAYTQFLVGKGRLGRKTGAGFYIYEGKNERVDSQLKELISLPAPRADMEVDRHHIEERLFFRIINEAVLCLDEGVAGQPGKDAAGQIDLASVMGFGFAPFRGGIIRYAESIGAIELYKRFSMLAEKIGKRFEPCRGIALRAQDGRSFYRAL